MPAPLQHVDDIDSEALEAPSVPGDRLTVEARFDPGGSTCRQVTDVRGHAAAVEDEHERSDDDTQDRHADERHGREHRRLLAGDRQQEDRHDRIGQVGELIPEAHQRHRPSDGSPSEACAPQHPVGRRDPDRRSSRHDDRKRGGRLGHHQRRPEAQAGKEHEPRRREGRQVDSGSHRRGPASTATTPPARPPRRRGSPRSSGGSTRTSQRSERRRRRRGSDVSRTSAARRRFAQPRCRRTLGGRGGGRGQNRVDEPGSTEASCSSVPREGSPEPSTARSS